MSCGEHHVFEPDGEGGHRHVARKAGTWAVSDGESVHYESGGAGCGVIYICMKGRESIIYDTLKNALESERAISVQEFKRGCDKAVAGKQSWRSGRKTRDTRAANAGAGRLNRDRGSPT